MQSNAGNKRTPHAHRDPGPPRSGLQPLLVAAVLASASPGSRAEPAERWRIEAGPGLVTMPQYPGSRGELTWPIPMVDIEYARCFFLRTDRGLGAYFLDREDVQAGTSLWFRRGRFSDESSEVSALGDIATAVQARLFANYTAGAIRFGVDVARDFGGSSGVTVDANADWRFQIGPSLRGSVGAETTYGNSKYMSTWFGVTQSQAAASGLAEYAAGSGFRSAGPTASLTYAWDRRWTFRLRVAQDFLVGTAADSPIVDRKALPTAAIGVTYRFIP